MFNGVLEDAISGANGGGVINPKSFIKLALLASVAASGDGTILALVTSKT